ncbi:MAG: antibiotic biosynthesis monooxygenase [Pseudomonadota bacterium]
MIIVSAELEFESEVDRDRAIEETVSIQQATREQEPGCRAYCFAADPVEPRRIQVYELWDDSASLAAHFEHPNYRAMVEALAAARVVSSANRACLIERQEPVYGPNGERKTAFFAD